MRITKRHLEIVDVFKKEKSYTKTALLVGVSRQRVHQIIKAFLAETGDIVLKNIYFRDRSKLVCPVCKRHFSKLVRYTSTGLCAVCLQYKKRGKRGRRPLLLPKTCSNCNTPFGKKNSKYRRATKEDLCCVCYQKTPKFLKHHKKQMKKWYRQMKKDPERYKKYLEYARKYQRNYFKKKKAQKAVSKLNFL